MAWANNIVFTINDTKTQTQEAQNIPRRFRTNIKHRHKHHIQTVVNQRQSKNLEESQWKVILPIEEQEYKVQQGSCQKQCMQEEN